MDAKVETTSPKSPNLMVARLRVFGPSRPFSPQRLVSSSFITSLASSSSEYLLDVVSSPREICDKAVINNLENSGGGLLG